MNVLIWRACHGWVAALALAVPAAGDSSAPVAAAGSSGLPLLAAVALIAGGLYLLRRRPVRPSCRRRPRAGCGPARGSRRNAPPSASPTRSRSAASTAARFPPIARRCGWSPSSRRPGAEWARSTNAWACTTKPLRISGRWCGSSPPRPSAWYNLGLLYRRQGRLEDAVAAYREAVRLQPDMAEALVRPRDRADEPRTRHRRDRRLPPRGGACSPTTPGPGSRSPPCTTSTPSTRKPSPPTARRCASSRTTGAPGTTWPSCCASRVRPRLRFPPSSRRCARSRGTSTPGTAWA